MERLLQRCFAIYFGNNRFNRWFAKRVRDILFERETRNTYELKIESVNWSRIFVARPNLTIAKVIWSVMSFNKLMLFRHEIKDIVNNIGISHSLNKTVFFLVRNGKNGRGKKLVPMKDAAKKAQMIYYMHMKGEKTRKKRKEQRLLKLQNK
jgi:hypothetical protein